MIRLCFLLLMSALMHFSFAQNFAWMTLNSGVSSGNLYDVVFYDDNLGFAVGNDGSVNYILRTTDGGDNWVNTADSITKEMVRAIDFTDQNTWYVVGRNGSLYITTNQGVSWIKRNLGTNANLLDISSPHKDAIYISTTSGRYIMYDGGWKTLTVNTQDDYLKVDFTSPSNGFLTASNGRIWRTTNGGNSWDTVKVSLEPILGSHFISEFVGYIVGPDRFYKRTINAGSLWSDSNAFPKLEWGTNYYAVYFQNHNSGFIGGTNGTILRTTNGGTGWIKENTKITETVNAISIPSPATGFAVANGGYILKRYDASSIEGYTNRDFVIYPNPATGSISFNMGHNVNYPLRVSIYDLNGKVLFSQDYTHDYIKHLDISFLNPGYYMISFTNEDFTSSNRLIVR